MSSSRGGVTASAPASRHAINFSWLVTLRWGALAGQLVTIVAVDGLMGIHLPLTPLACVLALGAASNAACIVWRRRVAVQEWMLAAVMLFDVVWLTAVLYLTGGPFNPFSFLYLVNIALAAVILPPVWTWLLVGFSVACFGGLFFAHVPLPIDHSMGHDDHPISMHVQGMWVAFGVAATFTVYFIQRVTRALARQDAELAEARAAAARHEKLASLATLAAGAAHELATPLSTIAVVAKELEGQLADQPAIGDARLIRHQVERCREILAQMSTDAGESAGEPLTTISLAALLDAALVDLPASRLRRALTPDALASLLVVPPRAVSQALRGVVKNALQASAPDGEVVVAASLEEGRWRIQVRDRGPGMTPEVLARAGEPFFTTKNDDGRDRGMGLGLFLARAVAERLGGDLAIESAAGRGTDVALTLPADGLRRFAAGDVLLPEAARR